MEKNIFYIVDVFTEEKYAGNQLAVIRHAENMSDAGMQAIAKEMNYSETTFIMNDEKVNNGYNVRIFTPAEEVPFAGHPTLGTAHIIKTEIAKEEIGEIYLNLKVGQIKVTVEKDNLGEILWMNQIEPVFEEIFEAEIIAASLGLAREDIDTRYPVQEVSTGLPFIIIPLKNLEAVKRAKMNLELFIKITEKCRAKAVIIFSPETYNDKNQLNARVFVDYYGVPEDPATGSANGCLAGYLSRYSYFGTGKVDIRVEQGYEIGRKSLLLLKADEINGKYNIRVGGKSITTARGELV